MSVNELIEKIRQTAQLKGFNVEELAVIRTFPILALSKIQDPNKPFAYASSGIHGDEPASPMALLELLKRNVFDSRYNWIICPLLNPSGLSLKSRNNADDIDLNRDFQPSVSTEIKACKTWLDSKPFPAVSFSLHEDYESTGFYLYVLGGNNARTIGQAALNKVSNSHPIEKSSLIDDHPALNGMIIPHDDRDPSKMHGWPEAVYLFERCPHPTFVFESPSQLPVNQRVNMLCIAATETIDCFTLMQQSASQQQ